MSTTSTPVQSLMKVIAPVRARLIAHPVYRVIQNPETLRTFMESHVYAVWDFMSLLKSLQKSLTCLDIPWIPRGSATTRFLVNEIVVGEESDVDEEGRRTSHFELYLRAMEQAGANTAGIRGLIRDLVAGRSLREAIAGQVSRPSVRDFLDFTFDTIASGEVHRVAAVFTFGLEDLIADMFGKIVADFPEDFGIFRYYLKRHIEVDGDHHSQLAIAMLEELCGADEGLWESAAQAVIAALEARIRLWDGVLEALGPGRPGR